MEKHDSVSVFLFNFREEDFKLLLLHHVKFEKWIVPGGHVEINEHQLEAAIREVKEETGISLSAKDFLTLNTFFQFPLIEGINQISPPLFIFEQVIPEYKGVQSHYHIDHVYCAVTNNVNLEPDEMESQKIGWYSEGEIINLNMFPSNQHVAKYLFDMVRQQRK